MPRSRSSSPFDDCPVGLQPTPPLPLVLGSEVNPEYAQYASPSDNLPERELATYRLSGTVFPLGDIHGSVGSPKQSISVGTISRKDREPSADADADLSGTKCNRILETFGNADGHGLAFQLSCARKQDCKLIAPASRDRITIPRDPGQSPGHFLQHLVTSRVAMRVVDVFETIDVEDEHDKLLVPASGPLEGVVEAITEEGTIGEVGKGIVRGEVPEAPFRIIAGIFRGLLIRYVAHEQANTRGGAACDRCKSPLKPPASRRDVQAVVQELGSATFEHTSDGTGHSAPDSIVKRLSHGAAEQFARRGHEQGFVRGPDR